MTDEQIRQLLSLTGEEARLLLEQNECVLYSGIQKKMVKLVREYDVQLPLNCLQFFYHVSGHSRKQDWGLSQKSSFLNCNGRGQI
jgi:hypothetical protein